MRPTVSVVIPFYNCYTLLIRAIESVLNQTFEDFEIILINDGSTDKDESQYNDLTKLSVKIKIINLKKNKGISYARNIGTKSSKGKYIMFLDADDEWESTKMEAQISYMRDNSINFCCTSFYLHNVAKKRTYGSVSPKVISYKDLLKSNRICNSSCAYNASAIGKIFIDNLRAGADILTWIEIFKKEKSCHVLQQHLVHYYVNQNSLSSNKFKSSLWIWAIFRNNAKLGLLESIFYFCNYSIRGILKHNFRVGFKELDYR